LGKLDNTSETSSDLSKGLGEWSLAAGRFFQSPQTQFVHLYHGEADSKAQTIPILENILFVLALFRARLVEPVQEGKVLLKHLLAFQKRDGSDDNGNFPVYLHEYPHCQDPALGLLLLAPFYWILDQFGHILGADLKQDLEEAARLALRHSLQLHQQKALPYFLAVRLAAAQRVYGLVWNNNDDVAAGTKYLEELSERQLEGWNTTKHLADILVGLQMVFPSLSDTPWSPLWQLMEHTWHPRLACYTGPCVREWQEGAEPQVNLYDLFGGFFSGQFSRRASLLSPHHLHGVLIQSSSDKFNLNTSSFVAEGVLKGQAWRTVYHPHCSFNLLEKNGDFQPTVDKTHTPFRFVWGDLHLLHSFVCQGGNIEKVNYIEEENSVTMGFDLRDQPAQESDAAPKREIEFFLDVHPDIQFHLNGLAATTFQLGEPLQITVKGYRLSMVFDIVQGKGDFLGHITLGNRPSQIDLKGEKRFQAYDRSVYLRTIRRQSECRMQVKLIFEK